MQGLVLLLTGEVDVDSAAGDVVTGDAGDGTASGTSDVAARGPAGEPTFGMSTTVGINPATGNTVESSTTPSAGGVLQDVVTGEVLGQNDVAKPPSP